MSQGPLKAGLLIDGRFTLDRKLGSGSTGVVWLANDAEGDRAVALKILHPKMGHDRVLVAQLGREARILAQLEHPHIARCYAFQSEGELVYLAMEWIEGRSLAEEMSEHAGASRPFTLAEVASIFKPLAAAVSYAHGKMIVHRDLKPQNVMVVGAELDRIKVLDFGIARLLEGNPFDATTMGRQLGSLFYMSPEQTRGEHADERSDVFALGTILFELLTLRRCWVLEADGSHAPAFVGALPGGEANALPTVFTRLSHAPRPRPSALRPELGAAFDQVIARALAVERSERFESVDLLLETVVAVLTAHDTAPTPVAPSPPGAPISQESTSASGDEAATRLMSSATSVELPGSTGPMAAAHTPAVPRTESLPQAPAPPRLDEPGPTVKDQKPFLATEAVFVPGPTKSVEAQRNAVLAREPTRRLETRALVAPLAFGLALLASIVIGVIFALTGGSDRRPQVILPTPPASASARYPELASLLTRVRRAPDDAALSSELWDRIQRTAIDSGDPRLRQRIDTLQRFRGTSRELEGLEGSVRILEDATPP